MLKTSLHTKNNPTLFNFIYIFSVLIFQLKHVNCSVKGHMFIYAGCSEEKYQTNSPYETNLNSFLSSVVTSSSQIAYNSFSVGNESSAPPDAAIYGLYQCRGDLKIIECSRCIQSAVNQIGLVCPYSYGAALQLDACYLRYEHSDFIGKPDTGVKFKKCSNTANNDIEFFRRRDDVLADLQTATGFKVSSSGLVQGYSQCLGDLNSGDCSACLATAVGMLKNLCGSAAAADVFLGHCYARYWASGYYELTSDSSNDDEVGKTVAIIVGTVAGLAVLIVLLSLCRKGGK